MPRILIIDDEENIRLTVKACLQAAGYDISTAINGEDGLEKFATEPADLILLDMKMPGKNGLEVLRELRQQSDVSVIMITAFGNVEDAVGAMKLGAVDYLRKPFTPDQIRRIIAEVLERKNLPAADNEDYVSLIQQAKALIQARDFAAAHEVLNRATAKEGAQAEPFNLLGVICEMDHRVHDAQKYYRAALALDPTYEPASANLGRTAQFSYQRSGIKME